MSTKVLVTGGAGFIGYHLAKSLAEESYQVSLCDNLFRGRMDRELIALCQRDNITFINCDLTRLEDMGKLGQGYEQVYHLAAINGTRYFYEMPQEVLRVNVLALINLLDWLAKVGGAKMLFASSSEVYGGTARAFGVPIPTAEEVHLTVDDVYNPRLSYAGSKIVGELMAINYGRAHHFPVNIVRYHNIYGPRMGYEHVIPEFCVRILRRETPFKIYGGDATRAFCYIADAIEATKSVMRLIEGEIVHVGNDREEIIMRELAERLFAISDFHPPVQVLPGPEGTVARRCPDISKLARLTAYQPKVSLDQGLRTTFAWYREAEASEG